jgi:hypothetical protein
MHAFIVLAIDPPTIEREVAMRAEFHIFIFTSRYRHNLITCSQQ